MANDANSSTSLRLSKQTNGGEQPVDHDPGHHHVYMPTSAQVMYVMADVGMNTSTSSRSRT